MIVTPTVQYWAVGVILGVDKGKLLSVDDRVEGGWRTDRFYQCGSPE